MDRIIILGEERELVPLAETLDKRYCSGRADVISYNDPSIGEKTTSNKLFLIGHADGQRIGRYYINDLTKDFGDHLGGAGEVYLSGCSTNSEAAQIIKNGFIPHTLAENVRNYLRNNRNRHDVVVYGTPGVLCLRGDGALMVEVTVASGYDSDTIFVDADTQRGA